MDYAVEKGHTAIANMLREAAAQEKMTAVVYILTTFLRIDISTFITSKLFMSFIDLEEFKHECIYTIL